MVVGLRQTLRGLSRAARGQQDFEHQAAFVEERNALKAFASVPETAARIADPYLRVSCYDLAGASSSITPEGWLQQKLLDTQE